MQAESQGQEQCRKGFWGLQQGGEGGSWGRVGARLGGREEAGRVTAPNLVATSPSGREGKAEGPGLSCRYKARVGGSLNKKQTHWLGVMS